MTIRNFFLTLFVTAALSIGAVAQTIVVNDPTKQTEDGDLEFTETEQAYFDQALVAVRKHIPKDTCGESLQPAGSVTGSFTRAGAKEMILFYEYCQTGNGFGWNGLVLVENGKITGNFVSDGTWGVEIRKVADVNRNGLDEFTLEYSGGLHQGGGGTGVDLMEFSNGVPVGMGWFQTSEFGQGPHDHSWKLTAKPGKVPVYYRQKFLTDEGKRPRSLGKATVAKINKKEVSKFEIVK